MADAILNASFNIAKKNNTSVKPIVFSICEWGFRKPGFGARLQAICGEQLQIYALYGLG